MLVLVAVAHARGGLAGLLGGLGTLPGLALFAWLWAVSVASARMALRSVPLDAPPGRLAQEAVAHGITWGGAAGAAFLAGVLLVLAVVAVAANGPAVLLYGLFFFLFGLLFAAFVGFFVGAACAALDAGLLLAARRLARA